MMAYPYLTGGRDDRPPSGWPPLPQDATPELRELRKQDRELWESRRPERLNLVDDQGNPLYVMTRSGNIRRTKPLSSTARQRVLERDGKCVRCKGGPPFQVDHITPYVKGGSNDLGNLQTLCIPCHREKGRSDANPVNQA